MSRGKGKRRELVSARAGKVVDATPEDEANLKAAYGSKGSHELADEAERGYDIEGMQRAQARAVTNKLDRELAGLAGSGGSGSGAYGGRPVGSYGGFQITSDKDIPLSVTVSTPQTRGYPKPEGYVDRVFVDMVRQGKLAGYALVTGPSWEILVDLNAQAAWRLLPSSPPLRPGSINVVSVPLPQ